EIFFSSPKEPLFFGKDLNHKWKNNFSTLEQYTELFTNVKSEKYIAEGSVWYLFSKSAAEEIFEYNPDSKIIIMLRQPTELINSMHKQFLFSGNEHIADINRAINLENERRNGQHINSTAHFPAGLVYVDIPKYYNQIKRYYDAFGRDQIHIILFDDLKKDIQGVYNGVLSFLGLNYDFDPDFIIKNRGKDHHKTRFKSLKKMLNHPPEIVDNFYKKIPKDIKSFLREKLTRFNSVQIEQVGLTNEKLNELKENFYEEIKLTEKLIQRDLSIWL
ncbi:MAG: sulfotransferase domain-containing protein, partial [Spirochaetes bacterium]|nr:sulfotransferase domain-containing protein [Spirochaetota bacterium]